MVDPPRECAADRGPSHPLGEGRRPALAESPQVRSNQPQHRGARATPGPEGRTSRRPFVVASTVRDGPPKTGANAVSERPRFEPEQTWQPLEERIELESDPRCRQLLTQVRDHMRTEIRGELDGLMATLVDEPRYHLWGLPVEAGPKGRVAVEEFYRAMIAGGGNHFHFDIQRIVVDHHSVVTEGLMRQRVPGAAVASSGIEEVDGEAVDPEATYLAITQILTVWPAAEDGRIMGEDIYFGSPPLSQLTRM
jgi:hypothetical protein